MIRAVFFDIDETLVDFDASARRAHIAIFGAEDGYDIWNTLTPTYWARFTSGELDFQAMREARMAAFLEERGLPASLDDAARMEHARWEAVERRFSLYDDVAQCLDELRGRGVRLGVISNNESAHQRRKLATVGLADAFDVVAISGEVGHAKPAPEIFSHACGEAGVAVDEAVHVGDLLDVDAIAATTAGLTGIWLDRLGVRRGDEPVPVVGSLTELVGVLDATPC